MRQKLYHRFYVVFSVAEIVVNVQETRQQVVGKGVSVWESHSYVGLLNLFRHGVKHWNQLVFVGKHYHGIFYFVLVIKRLLHDVAHVFALQSLFWTAGDGELAFSLVEMLFRFVIFCFPKV